MKHIRFSSKPIPVSADECCECQARKAEMGKVADAWDKCEKLGVCEGASYVCIPD